MKTSCPKYKDSLFKKFPEQGSIVIFDLEFTSWVGTWERGWSEHWEHREIVQIGAVLVNIKSNFEIIKKFNCYVKPTINKTLSDYFIDLTGINQKILEEKGVSFPDAFSDFLNFQQNSKAIFSNGTDGEVLRENCKLNNISYTLDQDRVINLRSWIAKKVSSKVNRKYEFIDSGDLLKVLTNNSDNEKQHDALYDAVNIAKTLKMLMSS